MKNSKNIKTLISIIVLIFGILMSTQVQAAKEFKVFYNDVKAQVVGGRLKPYNKDGFHMACIQPHSKYKATLTLEEYTKYKETYNGKDSATAHDHADNTTKKPWTDAKYYMKYTQSTHIETKEHQDTAYILATSKERGQMYELDTAHSIWASSVVDRGIRENPKNELAAEAEAYRLFYEKIHDKEGNVTFEIKDKTDYKKENPQVCVDQTNGKYTVGSFKVKYPDGAREITYNNSNTNTGSENSEQITKDMIDSLQTLKEACKNVYNNSEVIINTKTIISKYNNNINSVTKDELDQCIKKLKASYRKLVETPYNKEVPDSKSAKKEYLVSLRKEYHDYYYNMINIDKNSAENIITKYNKNQIIERDIYNTCKKQLKSNYKKITGSTYTENTSTTEEDKKKDVKFAWISKVELIGCDAEGKKIDGQLLTIDKDKHQFSIVNENGDEIKNTGAYIENGTIKYQENMNIPTNNRNFYVKFEHGKNFNENVKRIKVKVYCVFLESCSADMWEFEGKYIQCTWSDKTDQEQCCIVKENISHAEAGCTVTGCTTQHTKDVPKYKWNYILQEEEIETTQKLMGTLEEIKKNPGQKNVTLGGKEGIDITMELGGYVFLDRDEGKVNKGDNRLDKDMKEVIPGSEVWLYEKDTNNLVGVTMTDEKGHYIFTQLNAMKKYYVKFVYNGMLYTNVAYNIDNPAYNTEEWKYTSKATENSSERNRFNNKFVEIGSYPANYKTNSIFNGSEIYNPTYKQEEIVDIFKALTNQIVKDKDVKTACNNLAQGKDDEYKRKLQFAADCRISAYTNEKGTGTNSKYHYYPIYNKFTISTKGVTIGKVEYKPIYDGQYWINLGIKGRPTFDLYLTKDVFNATVSITTTKRDDNGNIAKDENGNPITNTNKTTYNYNHTLHRIGYYEQNGFPIGINENDYLEIMRSKYTPVHNIKTLPTTTGGQSEEAYNKYIQGNTEYDEPTEYTLEMRPEEVAEGRKNEKDKKVGYTGTTGIENKDNKTYVESDNPSELNVEIKYKIEITNESSILGGPTEIVDYYDKKYTFVDAYIGDENAKPINKKITWSDTSLYEGRPNIYKTSNNYNTKYLQPENISLTNGQKLYVYITLKLNNPSENLKTLLNGKQVTSINLAEINGYRTYNTNYEGEQVWGLVDKDSTPGNLDIRGVVKTEQDFNKEKINKDTVSLEDDAKRAPAFVYKKRQSKTIEGIVFEDGTWSGEKIKTNETREGDGKYTEQAENGKDKDKGIEGVIVELVNLTTGGVVAKTTTNSGGWYGFTGFVAGNYKVRFTYGHNDDTAMATNSKLGKQAESDEERHQGLNDKSYNGQDFQSTTYPMRDYTGYWYDENKANATRYSDAEDTDARINGVKHYSNITDNVTIVNHKAEVFNSYKDNEYYTNYYPEIDDTTLGQLQYELKKQTYRQAETPTITVQVEQAKTEVDGNQPSNEYVHEISNIDFGIAERPRSELIIDQDVKHIKVTAADGTVLFNTERQGNSISNGNNNLQWGLPNEYKQTIFQSKFIEMTWGNKKLTKEEKINIIMDDELISGSTLEITYDITVTNNGEAGIGKTQAKNIINYVSNNLTFDENDNKNSQAEALWEIAKVDDIQKDNNTTYINSRNKQDYNNGIDLSTQQTILKATDNNPLITVLLPNESTTTTLKLKKVLSAENASDDLKYTNMTEIVEIYNEEGRYDHGAIPGNQDLKKNPTEHDTSGASNEAAINDEGFTPPDGEVVITPPTGSKMIYYAIGITATIILAGGIYLIKKFVIDRK